MDAKEFEKWEREVEEMIKRNNVLLKQFKSHLKNKSLTTKTINKHIYNVEFFINDFLLRHDVLPPEEGIENIDSFLGDYFIRKTTWASKATINENVSSFKKFYAFLAELGKISKEEEQELKYMIKEEKSYWIEGVEQYNNDLEGYLDDYF